MNEPIRFTPHVTVATIVCVDQKFLLVEENINGQVCLNQPAGHLEENEGLIEAAIRETLEETGWHIKPTHYLGVCVLKAKNDITYVRHTFCANPVSHDANLELDTGIIGTQWLTLEEIKAEKDRLRSHLVITTCEQYIENQLYPLSLVTSVSGNTIRVK